MRVSGSLCLPVIDLSRCEPHFQSAKFEYYDHTLSAKGIIVVYHDKSHKKKIKLIVTPDLILDNESASDHIPKLFRKLEKHIGRYFHSEYELNDFKLAKMGIVVDINVSDRKKAVDYMKAVQRIGKVKGFSSSSDNNDDTSFHLEGNSNGIEFMLYNLETRVKGQLKEMDCQQKTLRFITENTEGVLQAEVWLTMKAIQGFTDETALSERIGDLLKNSEKIFLNTFVQIIPYGNFYKKNKAIEIIQKKVADRTLRRKMLRLLALVPKKKSLLLAQKTMNCRRIKEVMYQFYTISVSPVTLSKRHEVKFLKNLYEYI
jgi:hypothetical protein